MAPGEKQCFHPLGRFLFFYTYKVTKGDDGK